jgi:hypothetical protein
MYVMMMSLDIHFPYPLLEGKRIEAESLDPLIGNAYGSGRTHLFSGIDFKRNNQNDLIVYRSSSCISAQD